MEKIKIKQQTPQKATSVAPRRKESDSEFRRNAPDIMTTEEAARFLNVCPATLNKLASEGVLPFKRIGAGRIYGKRALVEWVNT